MKKTISTSILQYFVGDLVTKQALSGDKRQILRLGCGGHTPPLPLSGIETFVMGLVITVQAPTPQSTPPQIILYLLSPY